MNRFTAILATGISLLAFASAAHAADLIIEQPAAAPMVEAASGSWDGFYIGAFGGYALGEAYDDNGDSIVELEKYLIGGINVGVNFTLTDGIILGVAADAEYLGLEGLTDDQMGQEIAYDLYWAGSLRGLIGFDGGAFMPYLTAGLAVAGAQVDASGTVNASDSNTHIGWTAGAGVAFAATENVSVDLQYRYSDFGTQDYTLGSLGTESIGFTTHQVTVGLNWKF